MSISVPFKAMYTSFLKSWEERRKRRKGDLRGGRTDRQTDRQDSEKRVASMKSFGFFILNCHSGLVQ